MSELKTSKIFRPVSTLLLASAFLVGGAFPASEFQSRNLFVGVSVALAGDEGENEGNGGGEERRLTVYSLRSILAKTPKQLSTIFHTEYFDVRIAGFSHNISITLFLNFQVDTSFTKKLLREMRDEKNLKKRKKILEKYEKSLEKERDKLNGELDELNGELDENLRPKRRLTKAAKEEIAILKRLIAMNARKLRLVQSWLRDLNEGNKSSKLQ